MDSKQPVVYYGQDLYGQDLNGHRLLMRLVVWCWLARNTNNKPVCFFALDCREG